MSGYRILQQGSRVLILVDGKLVADVSWQDAKRFGRNVQAVARLAHEWEDAERVAADAAILLRSGAPIGITDNSVILKEAVHMAVNDRDLRRFMPGIKSKEVLGRPTIRMARRADLAGV